MSGPKNRHLLHQAELSAELHALKADLQERRKELERAMSARSRFYASISHELRTPINAILGYSELLLDEVYGTLNERQALAIERTRRAGRHLLELVNDVLDLSKIEAGKLELQFEPVAFPAVLDDLFVTVKPLADQRGCALTLEPHGPPTSIITDPRRVRQILLNLVSNALKFGAGQPVELHYTAADGNLVELTVVDHGPGIPEEDSARIFEEFVQLGAGPAEGTGLGLPISRRLAQLLGGDITLASTPGAGSRFTLRLPSSSEELMRAETEGDATGRTLRPAAPAPIPVIVEAAPAAPGEAVEPAAQPIQVVLAPPALQPTQVVLEEPLPAPEPPPVPQTPPPTQEPPAPPGARCEELALGD